MEDRYKFIFVFLILLTLFVSLSSVSAEDLNTIQSGEVSGGVDVVGTSRDGGSGELSYDIPEDVKNVDYAGLFIHSYTAGSSNLVYGSECNVSITTNGESEQIANEQLVATEGSADDTVYVINDHVTKCFADYKMVYNITDKVQNASGKLTINVNSGPIEGYTYYNKIKLIGLVFAYNDDDSDKISYWVNSGQSWAKTDTGKTTQASFNVGTINNEISNATLDNYALSSVDGIYTLNGEDLIDSLIYEVGEYYNIYHKFDVMGMIKNGTNSLVYTPGEGSYSFRNVLAVLTLNQVTTASAKLSVASEYSGAVFAGTNNVLKVNVTNDGQDKSTYVVDLYADGVKVNSSQIQIAAGLDDILLLSDNTIRPVTADTVNGVSTTKVNYTVTVSDKASGDVLAETTLTPTLWYNGNLGKDLAYPAGTIESFNNVSVNGGIIIDTLDDSTYLGTKTTNRTDVWNVNVDEDAIFTNAYVYVAYNWDKTSGTIPVWTTTFNGVSVAPVASYRDQSNLGSYGKYGYGLVVYDVANLIQKGENSFVLNKEDGMTAVYPSTLIAAYNVTESDTITTAYIFNGADLLSNANNFDGRLVASNSVLKVPSTDGIGDAELHVFAASAQAGEGDLIVNGEEFADVWNGSSNSVNDFVVVLNDIKESNNVSFIAKGSTILALEQILVVSKFVPSVSANLASEYSGAAFAGTDNVLKLNLTNDGKGKSIYLVDFYVDGKKVNSSEISLDSGASDVLLLIDDTIRPVTADTVNGVSTTKVNYTAIVSDKASGDVLAETTLTPTLWYNGNLGKDLAYPAGTIESFNNVSVNGGIIIDALDDSTYLGSKTTNRTDVWNVNVDEDAVFTNAYVYVAYNWDKTNGAIPVWTTTFNGASISPVVSYRDQSNLGSYGKYGYGLVVYDVSALIKDGENSFVLNKEEGMTAVYPSTLIALYNVTESDTLTTVYMYNGADLLSNANNFNGRLVVSNSILGSDSIDDIADAELHIFAASAQAGEGDLIVNGEEFADVWNGSSNSVNDFVVVLNDIKESNNVSFIAKGSTILALEQILVVSKFVPSVSANLASEYSGAAFAGTDNVLKLNLTNTGHGKSTYLVDFYVDGKKLNSSEISLDSGASDVLLLIDDTIRPVTADTVNGVSTTKVNYTAVVSDKASGDVLAETTLTPTLWYNGNLGKDLAYPAGTIESFNNVSVNGGIIIDALDDSTYLGSKTTNRTDVWNVNVDEDAVFTNAYVYVAYNWDKTNGAIPVWTTTFNGASISPVVSYRDQSNLGNYGKYGYGLVVYDVSALIKDGENSFVLNKEDGMTAVYPSTLVALYNVTESDTITTVYMYNGADLLSNANNFNGRLVASNSILNVDLVDDIKEAELYVFAAGAQSGEGNLIVNGESFADVWNGSSNSVNEYLVDLTDSIKESNSVSFVATGSTILAIQQFVIVKTPAPKTSADLQKLIDDAKPGDTIDLGNDTYANVANVNITKDLTITGGIISGKEGEAIFVIPSKSEGGPSEVNITGVDFKVNNGNVIVKASADNGTTPTSIDTPAININNNTIDVAGDNIVPESVTVLELDSERGSLAPSSDIAVQGNTLASGINPFEFEVTSVAGGNGSTVIPVGGNIPQRQATVIHYEDMKTSTVNTAIEGRVGKYFEVNLTDANGNPLADKEVKIGFNGKVYNKTTNATGGVRLQINLAKKGLYTFAISFLGDDNYNASFEVSKINVTVQKTKLTTSNKSYKASAKTKSLTVTLKSAEYNKALPSKKITVTVNGKSYTAKTNSKGVATVKVSLSAKKTYSFTAKFAGDDRYAAASVTGKVTIK